MTPVCPNVEAQSFTEVVSFITVDTRSLNPRCESNINYMMWAEMLGMWLNTACLSILQQKQEAWVYNSSRDQILSL